MRATSAIAANGPAPTRFLVSKTRTPASQASDSSAYGTNARSAISLATGEVRQRTTAPASTAASSRIGRLSRRKDAVGSLCTNSSQNASSIRRRLNGPIQVKRCPRYWCTSTGDQTYTNADSTINAWNVQRDALASQMIALLDWTGPGSSKQNESQKAKLIAQGRQLLAAVHAAAA